MTPRHSLRGWIGNRSSERKTDAGEERVWTTDTGAIHVEEQEVHSAEALRLVDEILAEVRS